MNAFVKFNKGMLRMPIHWQLWLMVLVAANMFGPLFFLHYLEAQVVLGTILASMMPDDVVDGPFWLHPHFGPGAHLVGSDARLPVCKIGRHPCR